MKNEDEEARAHKLRCNECDGITLVCRVDENGKPLRRNCAICGMSTDMFCTGCKRFLCVSKDRSDKLANDDEIPAEGYYRMTQHVVHNDECTREHIFSYRSCYHIGHEDRMMVHWTSKRLQPTHLDRVRGHLEPNDFMKKLIENDGN